MDDFISAKLTTSQERRYIPLDASSWPQFEAVGERVCERLRRLFELTPVNIATDNVCVSY